MRAYVISTGAVFGLLTAVHIWRATEERHLATEPWYVLITLSTAVICLWAVRLLWRSPR